MRTFVTMETPSGFFYLRLSKDMLNAYSYYLPSLNLEELTILQSQMHPDNILSVKDLSIQSMANILALKVTE